MAKIYVPVGIPQIRHVHAQASAITFAREH